MGGAQKNHRAASLDVQVGCATFKISNDSFTSILLIASILGMRVSIGSGLSLSFPQTFKQMSNRKLVGKFAGATFGGEPASWVFFCVLNGANPEKLYTVNSSGLD